jgi:hypothetical protein
MAFACLMSVLVLAGCSPVSSGNISYIKDYVSDKTDFEIDKFIITEYQKKAQISAGSTKVSSDDFDRYAEQAASAILEAANKKNVPIYQIDICIKADDGSLILNWNTKDGINGTLIDYRSSKSELYSNVNVIEIQSLVGLSLERTHKIDSIEKYVIDNSFYKVDKFSVQESPSDRNKLTAVVTTKVISDDAMIVERFEEHAEGVATLVSEASTEVDLTINAVIVIIKNKDDETINSKTIFLN